MKKTVAALAALCVALFALSVCAQGEIVSMTFENETYELTLISADVVGGMLNVRISGMNGSVETSDGKSVIPFWVYATAGGEKYDSALVYEGSDGTCTYYVVCGFLPEELYIYAYGDEEHAVLLWRNTGGETAQAGGTAIPAALVGTWQGTGTPVRSGSAIALAVTVNADGSGEYTFQQAGYTESYAFTLESDSDRFSVNIPADNTLGIVSCEGTYSYADGMLKLHIVTSFAGGRQYEYDAELTKTVPLCPQASKTTRT